LDLYSTGGGIAVISKTVGFLSGIFAVFIVTVNLSLAFELALEAEDADKIEAPMKIAEDPEASGGKFIWPPKGVGSDQGKADFEIDIPADGDYVIWGRVICPNNTSDSFYVTFDTPIRQNIWDLAEWIALPKWTWMPVSQRKAVVGDALGEKKIFHLTKGKHTLTIWSREDGTQLDCIFISTNPDAEPVTPEEFKEAVKPRDKLIATWGSIKAK
jgi:hypothetical protein